MNRCYAANASVQLVAVDLSTSEASTVSTITADTGTVSAGTLSACSVVTVNQYINYTFKGNAYNLSTPAVNVMEATTGGFTSISAANANTPITLYVSGLQGTGTFSGGVDSAYIFIPGVAAYQGPVTLTVTVYGPIGGYIQGSFSGTLVDDNVGTDFEPITGTFYVQRTD